VPHDLADEAQFDRAGYEPAPDPPRPVDEQGHGGDTLKIAARARVRQRERRQVARAFRGQAEPLAAGGQHGELTAAVEQRRHHLAHGIQKMLTVIDHQKARTGAEQRDTGREHIAVDDAQIEYGRQRVADRGRIGHRCQQQHGHIASVPGRFHGEAGLAHTAGAHDGHQPLAGEQPLEPGHLGLTPDKWSHGPGNNVRPRAGRSPGDPALELTERGRGIKPGLGGQQAAVGVPDAQRVGAPASTSQRPHQEQDGGLPQGISGDPLVGETEGMLGLAHVDRAGHEQLVDVAAELFQGPVKLTLIMIYFAKSNHKMLWLCSLDGRHSVFALAK
jgi:hypothetical protein